MGFILELNGLVETWIPGCSSAERTLRGNVIASPKHKIQASNMEKGLTGSFCKFQQLEIHAKAQTQPFFFFFFFGIQSILREDTVLPQDSR